MLAPASISQAADLLRDLVAHGGDARLPQPLQLVGGGTRVPLTAGPVLSARNLIGITHYNPADMTVTVRAGMPLAELEEVLTASGQQLPFEPSHRGPVDQVGTPTIGAVVAMNNAGPRRPFAGSVRDAIVGAQIITGLGEVVATGSRVLKSVAGLDLTRLVAGSWGALGLIATVTIRLAYIPQASRTVRINCLEAEEFPALVAQYLTQGLPITGAAYVSSGIAKALGLPCEPAALLRLEGNADAVKAAQLLVADSSDRSAATAQLWAAIRDASPMRTDGTQKLWCVDVPVSRSGALCAALNNVGAQTLVDWRGGRIWASIDAQASTTGVEHVITQEPSARARLHQRLTPDHATGNRTTSPTHHEVSFTRLKQAFDPYGVFDATFFHRAQSSRGHPIANNTFVANTAG